LDQGSDAFQPRGCPVHANDRVGLDGTGERRHDRIVRTRGQLLRGQGFSHRGGGRAQSATGTIEQNLDRNGRPVGDRLAVGNRRAGRARKPVVGLTRNPAFPQKVIDGGGSRFHLVPNRAVQEQDVFSRSLAGGVRQHRDRAIRKRTSCKGQH
jgi:hypothetical protein